MAEPAFRIVGDKSALLVVDMQNDFVRVDAPLEVPDARATIPAIRRLIDAFHDLERPVIFTKFLAGPGRTLIWDWSPQLAPPTCCCWSGFQRTYPDIDGPRDCAAVIDELAPRSGDLVVEKFNYDAFHNTNLRDLLQARRVETVVVTGTVTQICVDETGRGAFKEGIQAVIAADAVSSYAPDLHDATLKNFHMKFGRVLTTDEVLAELSTT